MSRAKNKKLFGDFYTTIHKNGEEIKIPYDWQSGEKEEYLKTCDIVEGWGGVPLDVAWAKSTIVYKEAFVTLSTINK